MLGSLFLFIFKTDLVFFSLFAKMTLVVINQHMLLCIILWLLMVIWFFCCCCFLKLSGFTGVSDIYFMGVFHYSTFFFQVFLFIQLLQVPPLQQLMWTLMLFLEENLLHQNTGLQVVKTALWLIYTLQAKIAEQLSIIAIAVRNLIT